MQVSDQAPRRESYLGGGFGERWRKEKMRVQLFRVATALLFVGACTEATGVNLSNVPGYLISEVRVSPSIDTIFVFDPIRLSDRISFTASATGKNGATLPSMTFAWSTSDPFVATVDSAGVVTPMSVGVVEISASADKIGRATLVILPATMTLSISPATDTIVVSLPVVPARDTLRLVASARDLAGAV